MAVEQGVNHINVSAKRRKNELRPYNKIPVWVCEYHQEVLPYIYRAIGSKHLPYSGITLLHFDSHPDLMVPFDMKADSVYEKDFLFDVISIADWIIPAVYVGHIGKVIWIKPPWATQIADKTLCFKVGRHRTERTIRVSCNEKYFCEDGLFSPQNELENSQELILLVKTMPVRVLDITNLNASSSDVSLKNTCGKTEHKCDTSSNKEEILKRNIDMFINDILSSLEVPYILDIDMDFFSTLNPFRSMFTQNEFQTLGTFYKFPDVKSGEDMMEASRLHKENVDRLARSLKQLESLVSSSCKNDDVDDNFIAFIKEWRKSREDIIDYDMVHSAGMTVNLPVHVTEKEDILKIIKDMEILLCSIPNPTIITVARSSDDDYTPPESVEFIQQSLIKCLGSCFKENIEFHYEYLKE